MSDLNNVGNCGSNRHSKSVIERAGVTQTNWGDMMTDRARRVIVSARLNARHNGEHAVYDYRVLQSLAFCGSDKPGSLTEGVLRRLGADERAINDLILKLGLKADNNSVNSEFLPLSESTLKLIAHARLHAQELGHTFIGAEHLLLGAAMAEIGPLPAILALLKIDTETLITATLVAMGVPIIDVSVVVGITRGSKSIKPETETVSGATPAAKAVRAVLREIDCRKDVWPPVAQVDLKTKQFATGAVRSTDADNVRYDLVSPIGHRRLAETCAKGARKYGDNNWLKGIPASDLLNHALQHIGKFLAGDTSEDHLAHASWNLFAVMHFEETRPELIDVPHVPAGEPAGEPVDEDAPVPYVLAEEVSDPSCPFV